MARKKTPPAPVSVGADLARRLREIREKLFGESGGPELARRLGLPARTWYNYETGVTVPAEVLLQFIDITGANPAFLFNGEGEPLPDGGGKPTARPVAELLREALERLEAPGGQADGGGAGGPPAGHVAIPLFPFDKLATARPGERRGEVLARREWIPNPSQTVAARVPDDAMHPVIPRGSIVVIDRSQTDPDELQGKIVAATISDGPVIRWLDVSGDFLILRPNPSHRDVPLPPVLLTRESSTVFGKVVCSWNVHP